MEESRWKPERLHPTAPLVEHSLASPWCSVMVRGNAVGIAWPRVKGYWCSARCRVASLVVGFSWLPCGHDQYFCGLLSFRVATKKGISYWGVNCEMDEPVFDSCGGSCVGEACERKVCGAMLAVLSWRRLCE